MTYQLTAPLLDACVLGVVENEDIYGYTLTQKVMDVVDISESTLYPVLRRLQKDGLLITYDQPYQGRNRRYYKITAEGSNRLFFFRREWENYKEKINKLIGAKAGQSSDPGTGLYSLSEETVSGTVDGHPVSLTLFNTETDQQNENTKETSCDTEGGTQ